MSEQLFIEINCKKCGTSNHNPDEIMGDEDGDNLYCPTCSKPLPFAGHSRMTRINQSRWVKLSPKVTTSV